MNAKEWLDIIAQADDFPKGKGFVKLIKKYGDMRVEEAEYESLTIQLLHLRNEVYAGSGMDQQCFDNTYLNGLGEYELNLAKREGITL